MVLTATAEPSLRRWALSLVTENRWPSHLAANRPAAAMSLRDIQDALTDYLKSSKGESGAADLLSQCMINEMPAFVVQTLEAIQKAVNPPPTEQNNETHSGTGAADTHFLE